MSRAIAPGVLDSDIFGFQTLQYIMKVTRTWDACLSMLPKGGKTIWGDASWSPEEGYDCTAKRSDGNKNETVVDENEDGVQLGRHGKPFAHYGRMVAFGKDVASLSPEAIIAHKQEVKVNSLTALNIPLLVWVESLLIKKSFWKTKRRLLLQSILKLKSLGGMSRKGDREVKRLTLEHPRLGLSMS